MTAPLKRHLHALSFLLAIAASLFFVMPAAAQSLRESAQEAIKTNPRVDVVARNRQAVEQELARARGQYLPQVDLRAGALGADIDGGDDLAHGIGQRYGDGAEAQLEFLVDDGEALRGHHGQFGGDRGQVGLGLGGVRHFGGGANGWNPSLELGFKE